MTTLGTRTAREQDTEITLGSGKLLLLFFGLVALCAVFFGLGFKLGRSSAPAAEAAETPAVTGGGARPSAVKAKPSSDLTFYKSVEQDNPDAQLPAAPKAEDTAAGSASQADKPVAPAEVDASAAADGGYYVQVAAVSKQEDADALVDALKRKQYTAFSGSQAGDKLFHVQVGPFADVKTAESIRSKLISDGYNPILKK